jgi:hypothetical protein
LTPVAFHKNKALAMWLRHHQVPAETERKARVANGSVHRLAQSWHEVRWENLAKRYRICPATASRPIQ